MGLTVPLFAVAFNVLFWFSRAALAPAVSAQFGHGAGWAVACIGPAALLGIVLRLGIATRDACVLLASVSVAVAALCVGW